MIYSERLSSPSKDFQRAHRARKKLDSVSQSLCLAKWLKTTIHLPSGMTHSCYLNPAHQIDGQDLLRNPHRLHNTPQKLNERRQMRQGERPAGCSVCWKTESLPNTLLSPRHFKSSEDWAIPHLESIVNDRELDHSIVPTYVEVDFSSICNFKCAYCSPHLSTSWQEHVRKFGPYPTLIPHNDLVYFEQQGMISQGSNQYSEAFWKWWPELYPKLKVFRMTGGEPLLDKNTFRVLDWIRNNPHPELELSITSNLCPPPALFRKFLDSASDIVRSKKIGRLNLYVSIDSWGPQAEYIRDGLSVETLWSNVRSYLSEIPRGHLSFILSVSNLSVWRMQDLLEKILELRKHVNSPDRVSLDTAAVVHPAWMSLQILSQDLKLKASSILDWMMSKRKTFFRRHGFDEFHLEKFRRVHLWQVDFPPSHDLENARIDFYRFFHEYDRRRGFDLLKTFPELREFWLMCQDMCRQYEDQRRRDLHP